MKLLEYLEDFFALLLVVLGLLSLKEAEASFESTRGYSRKKWEI